MVPGRTKPVASLKQAWRQIGETSLSSHSPNYVAGIDGNDPPTYEGTKLL
jgi:hypothetical protein